MFSGIQETKAQDDQVVEALEELNGYHIFSNSATKKGYSGVAILTKEEPIRVFSNIGIEEHDDEGRVITAEYSDFFLVNVYVPNSGSGLKRLDYRSTWDQAFKDFLAGLQGEEANCCNRRF
jgi:exodeoxyribonuclease-3